MLRLEGFREARIEEWGVEWGVEVCREYEREGLRESFLAPRWRGS